MNGLLNSARPLASYPTNFLKYKNRTKQFSAFLTSRLNFMVNMRIMKFKKKCHEKCWSGGSQLMTAAVAKIVCSSSNELVVRTSLSMANNNKITPRLCNGRLSSSFIMLQAIILPRKKEKKCMRWKRADQLFQVLLQQVKTIAIAWWELGIASQGNYDSFFSRGKYVLVLPPKFALWTCDICCYYS